MLEKLKFSYLQVISAGILSILLVVVLFPKLPLLSVSETFVAIRIEDFILLLFSILALPLLWQKRKEIIKDNLILAIFGFFTVGLISVYSAIFVTTSVTPHLAILHLLRRVEYLSPFFLIYALSPDRRLIKKYLAILFFVSLLVFIYGVGQMFLDFPVFSTSNTEFAKGIPLKLGPEARVNSTFAGHYDLAAFTAMILPIIIAFIFGVSFAIREKVSRIFLLGLAGLNLWLLLQTASRISFIAYLAGVIAVLLLLKKKWALVLILLLSLLSLLSSSEIRTRFSNTLRYGTKTLSYQVSPHYVFAQTATKSANETTKEATQSATSSATPKPYEDVAPGEPTNTQQLGVFRSSRVRFDREWPLAWRSFLRNPLLGSGYSSLGLATDNDYLRSLGEVGILGTFAFFLIFYELGKRIYGYLKNNAAPSFEKTVVIAITGVIAAFLVNATFIDVFEASKVATLFWLLVGILVVTINLESSNN